MLHKKFLPLILLPAITLISCSSGSCNNSDNKNYNLVVDNGSPVPLINGKKQPFYIYIKNTGAGNATNLNWTINDLSSSSNQKNTFSQLWTSFKETLNISRKPQALTTGIEIIDASGCSNIPSGTTCRILLSADDIRTVALQSTSSNNKNAITTNLLSSYQYTPSYTSAADTLTLSPLNTVNYGNGFAGYTFFIMNNSNNTIALESNVFGSLPAGLDYTTLIGNSCANPMPAHTACQVRITLTTSSSNNSTIPVNLTPTGSVVGGSTLPPQGNNVLTVSDEKVGNVTTSTPHMSIDANEPKTVSQKAYISNTGSGALIIEKLSTANSAVTISGDECSGKTLSPSEICSYQLNIDSNQVSSSGAAVINIPFNNSKIDAKTSTTLNWSYVAATTPNPSITLSNSGNLTQQDLTSSITIRNTGNVLLRNLTAPIITTTSRNVTLTNGNCGNTLAIGGSCYYTLTYAPVAPSENTTLNISGINAKYIDTTGNLQSINFPASTAVNINSIYQGFISTGGDITLNKDNTSHVVTLTNDGNYTATIANVVANGNNLAISNNSCNSQTLATNGTCNFTVSLSDSTSAGSGNGNFTVTYNNHNGNPAATAVSNISWVIGESAALGVTFNQTNLVANVGNQITDEVTLTNTGNTVLNNITLPSLSAPFSWANGSSNSCVLNGTQTLARNASCKLTLIYAPTVSNTSGTLVTLGKFSATTGQSSAYSTNDYTITVTALRQNSLSFDPSSVIIAMDWSVSPPVQNVVVTNLNGSTINSISAQVSAGLPVTFANLCTSLNSGESCTMGIAGSGITNGSGSLTFSYTDTEGTMSQTLPVIVTYQAQPIVTPDLLITKNPSGTITLLNNGNVTQITLTLTNNTTVQNTINPSTDGILKVKASSLIPSTVNNATITHNGGSCSIDGNGYISLSNQNGSNSCTYTLDVTTTAAHNTQVSVTATSQYQSKIYSSPTDVNYSADIDGPQIAYNAVVQSAIALLNTPTLIDSNQNNAFNGIEQGVSSPSVSFSVTNVGAAALIGSITPPSIIGFTFNMPNCNNLAAGASCTFTAVLNSNTVTSGNLSNYNLTYGAGLTAALPNMTYSVIAANSPTINSSISVSNCQQGTGIESNTCFINTGYAAPVVTITMSNAGSATAQDFTVDTTALVTALGNSGYSTTLTNTCSALPQNQSCTIVINPSAAIANASETLYDINSTISYSYKYGSNGQMNGNGNKSIIVNTTVTTPTLSISAIESVAPTGTTSATITLSNWYSSTLPSTPSLSGTATTTPEIAITNCATWTSASYGGTCLLGIATTSASNSIYTLAANINGGYSGTISATPATLTVVDTTPKLHIFVTSATYNGDLKTAGNGTTGFDGANNICNTRASAGSATSPLNANWKALLYNNNATVSGTTYYDTSASETEIATATGGDLVGKNAISSAIKYDENGTEITSSPMSVWTNGNANTNDCSGWTVNSGGTNYGGYGNLNSTTSTWFYSQRQGCNVSARLYCVQQQADG